MAGSAQSIGASEIEQEAEYLVAARAALGRMRAGVLATETPEFVSADSDEVWFNTMYRLARARRGAELVDMPEIPLFFGRLDYEPGAVLDRSGTGERDRIY